MALTPEEEAELKELESAEEASGHQGIVDQLDPSMPLLPQALAAQPASTNPDGDEAAQKEWMRNPEGSAKGTVFVYEPPIALARREMMENPEVHKALFPDPDFQPTPEDIAKLDEKSITYQAYADKKWRDTAEAAASSGKTAYRYSKSPWLQSGGAMSAIDTLGMKLKGSVAPAFDTVSAFVMGVDDTATFGGIRKASEVMGTSDVESPEEREKYLQDMEALGLPVDRNAPPLGKPRDEIVGGPTEGAKSLAESNDAVRDAHPYATAAGQVTGIVPSATSLVGLGALKPWSASNALYDVVASGGKSLAGKVGVGTGIGARLATSGAAAVAGGAAVQGGQEAVDAAASMAQTGGPGTSLEEAGERVRDAGLNPLNVGLGVGGEALGSLAAKGSDWFRNGSRYKGAPGRFEQTGGTFELGKGPVPPKESAKAIEGAKKLDVDPVDVMAREVAPKIAEGQKRAVEEVTKRVGEENAAYHATNEGQMLLPVTNTQQTALKILREHHAPAGGDTGKLKPIANPAAARKVQRVFNSEIQSVSTKPKEGAIEMTVDEAEAFLDPQWKRKLLPSKKPPAEPTGGGGKPNNITDLQRPKTEAPPDVRTAGTIPPKGKEKRPDGVIQGLPQRDVTPTKLYPASNAARNDYGEAMAPYRDAQRADNARVSKLSDEPGMNPDRHIPKADPVLGAVESAAAKARGGRVTLAELRGSLPGTKAEQDVALKQLQRDGKVVLMRNDNTPSLTKADHDSALMVGDSPRHLVYLDNAGGGARETTKVDAKLQPALDVFKGSKEPLTKHQLQEKLGKHGSPEWEVEQLEKQGLIRRVENIPGKHAVDGRWEIVGGAAVLAGTAASQSKDSNVSAAGAGIVGLAQALKRKGVEKVYVTPRRYNSAQHETLKRTLETLQPDPRGAGAREARELYIATLKDRDARPRNGVPGGWSAHQAEHAQQIEAVKAAAELAAPGGDAFPALVSYANQRPGELPRVEAVRAAADRAGVRQNIERIRNLDPLKALRSEMGGGAAGTGRQLPQTAYGAASRFADAGMMRLGYPAMRMLESHTGVRGGRAGKAAMLSSEEERKKKRESK
jgi:hypothetical protein